MANSNLFLPTSSPRRIEALKFLTSISLDGTNHSNSAVSVACNADAQNDFVSGIKKPDSLLKKHNGDNADDGEKVFLKNNGGSDNKNNRCSGDSHSFRSESEVNTSIKAVLTKGILSYSTKNKNRSRIFNNESGTKAKLLKSNFRKKKVERKSTCSDSERPFGSCCKSIGPIPTHLFKTRATACKTITEVNGGSQVKVKSIKDHKFNGERIFMVTKRRVPFLVCSFIPYGTGERNRSDFHKEVLRKRHASRSRPLSTIVDSCNQYELFGIIKSEDGQEVSYGKLLVPMRSFKDYLDRKHNDVSMDVTNYSMGHHRHLLARCYSYEPGAQRGRFGTMSPSISNSKDNMFVTSILLYNPMLLDDPELIAGKHRTLLTFSSYVTSVIDYVRPYDLKREINDKFKEKFPYIKLTLSKLRSIKKEMCKIARSENGTELVTVAQAYVYFEKLILRGLVNKHNRKLCAAASLLLSAKLNDFKGGGLRTLIERMENMFRINRKELFESEFAVLVALEFGLHIPASEVFPHYQRILYES